MGPREALEDGPGRVARLQPEADPGMPRPSLTIYHTEASTGWGGQEIRILTEMQVLRARGHSLGLIAYPGAAILARAREAGFPVFEVAMRGPLDLVAAARVARLLRRAGVQILNTHSSVDAWVGGWAARCLGIPIVRTRHLAIPVQRNPLSPRVYDWMADHVVTTGDRARELIMAQAGLPPGRLSTIPTGVDLGRFDPTRANPDRLRRELGLDAGTRLVGVVAVIRTYKGHSILFQALAAPPLRGRPLHLIIAGASFAEKTSMLRDEAVRLGVGPQVTFLGHREDVEDILAACDVVALPSIRDEGVPQVILQALALGRAVVASDVGGIRQVVQDNVTGLLVPAEDPQALGTAVARLLDDPDLAASLGGAGRRMVHLSYGVERMGEAMEAVYRSLVSRA